MPGAVDELHTLRWELHFPLFPNEHVLFKTKDDGFGGTGLDRILAASGVRSIPI